MNDSRTKRERSQRNDCRWNKKSNSSSIDFIVEESKEQVVQSPGILFVNTFLEKE